MGRAFRLLRRGLAHVAGPGHAGAFILLFSAVGLYGLSFGIAGNTAVSVPASLGLPVLLVFNAIMLTSAGSTLDSTFASAAKLAGRD